MMISVTVANNMKRTTEILDANTTLRAALEGAGIDYMAAGLVMSLDGCPLQPGDLDKTFAQFGITEKCFLMGVVKADNA